jgi:P pilus assembly chaperone PapD
MKASLARICLAALLAAGSWTNVSAQSLSDAAAPGAPSAFDVKPMSVLIGKGQSSGSITVAANGDGESHFTVTGYRWKQGPDGKTVLEPADDLIFYPQSFDLVAGKTMRIRVGAPSTDPSIEQSYRIVVYKLPPKVERASGKGHTLGMGVGLRISVPVFVAPAGIKDVTDVRVDPVTGDRLNVDVLAAGNVHVPPSTVHVVASDAAGKRVLEAKTTLWYALAGQSQRAAFPIVRAQCGAISKIDVEVSDPLGTVLTKRTVPATKSCN